MLSKSVVGILSIFFLVLFYFTTSQFTNFYYLNWVVFLLPFSILLGGYLYSPYAYEIGAHDLIIHRKIGVVQYSLLSIKEVHVMEYSDLGFVIRTFGNGGLFGYTGWYYSKKIGKMRWYARQRKNIVLLTLSNGKKILLTPDDREAFVEELRASISHS